MKISRRVSYLFTVVAFAFPATFASAQVEWNHNPMSAIGPNFWGELTFPFATCGGGAPFVEVGKKQTPVDVFTGDTVAAGLPALAFLYQTTPFVVTTTGHDVRVNYVAGSGLRVGPDEYEHETHCVTLTFSAKNGECTVGKSIR